MDLKSRIGYAAAGASVATAVLFSGNALAQRVYSDVPSSHWAYNAVQWVSQYGVMTGPGGTSGFFNAAGLANRAEIATVLYRFYNLLERDINDLQVRVELLEDEIEGRNRSSSSSSRRSSSSVSGVLHSFSAALSGSQEVPSVSTTASGVGNFSWNESANSLSYNITVQGLSGPIIAAHFHTGSAGQEGGPIRDIVFNGNNASATWTNLSSQERIDLFAGRLYVNVHTAQNPDGEIRGQVLVTGTSLSSSSRSSSSMSSSSLSSMSSSFSSSGFSSTASSSYSSL